jgi:hypothetical protein
MTNSEQNTVLLALGKAQVDAMFRRQDIYTLDDLEFLPLLETVLTAFETAEIEKDVAEQIWDYAFAVYDRACKEAEPSSTTAENRKLMREYLLGPHGFKRKAPR